LPAGRKPFNSTRYMYLAGHLKGGYRRIPARAGGYPPVAADGAFPRKSSWIFGCAGASSRLYVEKRRNELESSTESLFILDHAMQLLYDTITLKNGSINTPLCFNSKPACTGIRPQLYMQGSNYAFSTSDSHEIKLAYSSIHLSKPPFNCTVNTVHSIMWEMGLKFNYECMISCPMTFHQCTALHSYRSHVYTKI
jgi:hypothetical protein